MYFHLGFILITYAHISCMLHMVFAWQFLSIYPSMITSPLPIGHLYDKRESTVLRRVTLVLTYLGKKQCTPITFSHGLVIAGPPRPATPPPTPSTILCTHRVESRLFINIELILLGLTERTTPSANRSLYIS